MTPLMVMSPSSAKLVLVLSLDFGLTDSELSLIEIWRINWLSRTLLEVCPTHKDKIEIKCMGSVDGKTPTKLKLYLFFSSLGTLNKMKLMLYALFNYNMGGKIRRLNMNVEFKFIWPKRSSFLTYRRIVHKVLIFTWLWLSSFRDKLCTFLACLVETCEIKRVVLGTSLRN
jgi:hypothetical protein